jgi:shikimate kinase
LCWHRIEKDVRVRPLGRDRSAARGLYDNRRAVYDEARLRVKVSEDKPAEMLAAEIADALTPQAMDGPEGERE